VSDADVAVIAAGVGGSLCASLLAAAGASVLLIGRDDARRRSVELVSGPARRLLARYGHHVEGRQVVETVSVWGTGGLTALPAIFNPWGAGVAVERSTLADAERARAAIAGAWCLSGAVQAVDGRAGSWRVTVNRREHRAAVVVLATGRSGSRMLRRRRDGRPREVALTASLPTGAPARADALLLEDGPEGWWYALPDPRGGRFVGFSIAAA
jgi:flavin-dependent dehydrogenase